MDPPTRPPENPRRQRRRLNQNIQFLPELPSQHTLQLLQQPPTRPSLRPHLQDLSLAPIRPSARRPQPPPPPPSHLSQPSGFSRIPSASLPEVGPRAAAVPSKTTTHSQGKPAEEFSSVIPPVVTTSGRTPSPAGSAWIMTSYGSVRPTVGLSTGARPPVTMRYRPAEGSSTTPVANTGGVSRGVSLNAPAGEKAASEISSILPQHLLASRPVGTNTGDRRIRTTNLNPPSREQAAAEVSWILAQPLPTSQPARLSTRPLGRMAAEPSSSARPLRPRHGAARQAARPSSASRPSEAESVAARRVGGPSTAARGSPSERHAASSAARPSTTASGLSNVRRMGTRSLASVPLIRLGIETEFLLAARSPRHSRDALDEFVTVLAAKYNWEVALRHPRMLPSLQLPKMDYDLSQWSFVYENSNVTQQEPWGLEMRTPVIEFRRGWRNDVITTWNFLQKHYHITSNHECGTHIHISLLPEYDLDQIKRIASAIIYFEPAFEAFMPESRRGCEWARSIWLESPHLAKRNQSRSQSIEAIQRATDIDQLLSLLHVQNDASYSWNFWNLENPKNTIEFRQPPASETADEALSWAELAVNFVQVSITYGSAATFRNYPATIKGLRWYLQLFNERGVNEPGRMERLWAGKPPNAALEPVYEPVFLDSTEENLEPLKKQDMRIIRRHPYFN